jgi:hypothetical protein
MLLAACGGGTATPTADNGMTSLVGDILSNPQAYQGKTVVVVGYFRGWDLLQEAGTLVPVTRSDWVVTDNSGAIYASAAEMGFPQGLSPSEKGDTTFVIRVVAVVALTEKGQPYLLPSKIDFLN